MSSNEQQQLPAEQFGPQQPPQPQEAAWTPGDVLPAQEAGRTIVIPVGEGDILNMSVAELEAHMHALRSVFHTYAQARNARLQLDDLLNQAAIEQARQVGGTPVPAQGAAGRIIEEEPPTTGSTLPTGGSFPGFRPIQDLETEPTGERTGTDAHIGNQATAAYPIITPSDSQPVEVVPSPVPAPLTEQRHGQTSWFSEAGGTPAPASGSPEEVRDKLAAWQAGAQAASSVALPPLPARPAEEPPAESAPGVEATSLPHRLNLTNADILTLQQEATTAQAALDEARAYGPQGYGVSQADFDAWVAGLQAAAQKAAENYADIMRRGGLDPHGVISVAETGLPRRRPRRT